MWQQIELREIRIFGDSPDTFYIGEIRTMSDNDPISIDPLDEQVVAVNDVVEFIGTAEGGMSALKFSWDFNAADGIQEDAVGRRRGRMQRHEQDHREGRAADRGAEGAVRRDAVAGVVRDVGHGRDSAAGARHPQPSRVAAGCGRTPSLTCPPIRP